MQLTVSFSEARQNLTEISERVANEGVEYTVFKRSKPLFKIVPVSYSAQPGSSLSKGRAEMAAYTARPKEERFQKPTGGGIPDGGVELFEYMMELRARTPRNAFLENLTAEELKKELANRYV